MADIIVERYSASKIKLYIEDEGIIETIYCFFQYEKKDFEKKPWSKWDGITRMYNKKTGQLPYGCLHMLTKLGIENGWTFEFDERFKEDTTKVDKHELAAWIDTLNIHSGGTKIDAYDYQLEAVYLSIRFNRMVLLAATSAGKSLIAYILVRYYEMLGLEKKILIIVPSQNLVTQMFDDFKDYSSENGWSTDKFVHYIMEGRPKNANKPIYISTWQSIYEEPKEYFPQFGSIICDEVHGASGDSISAIMGNSTSAYRRIGMTGTLKNDKVNPLLVTSNFGPVKRVVTTKELIEAGRATPAHITMLQLDYQKEERDLVAGMTYQEEIEFTIGHAYRNKIIENLALTLKGNTLILFDRKESHLYKVQENLEKVLHGKKVFVITGEVKNEERQDIKAAIETGWDIVILATYGTMAVGISWKKLHNLVFAHPSKSVIRVLQSIGRLLRLHVSKDVANIYDIIDNFSIGAKANFTLRWAMERLGFYKSEEHPVRTKKIPMKTHMQVISPDTDVADFIQK